MNRIFFFILLALLLAFASCTETPGDQPAAEPEPLFFGDPYVLVDDGVYYMYGTGHDSDTGITNKRRVMQVPMLSAQKGITARTR